MKLNYKRTILVGFAFFLICAFWQAYDNTVPLILTNNIAVLYDTETEQYSPSPLFDQGLCLFADTSNDYPLDLPMDVCMERIEAKPFSSDFDTQLDAAEELYGIQLHFSFTAKDVCTELDSLADYYPLEIRQRVEQIIRRQMRKYGYLMRS